MRTINTNKRRYRGEGLKLLLTVMMLFIVASCVKEKLPIDPNSTGKKGERYIQFNMEVPYEMKTAKTRAINQSDEQTIETIDVLAFRVDDSNPMDVKEYFDYHAEVRKGTGHNDGDPSQPFVSKVLVKTTPQKFVIITNASAEIRTLLLSNWEGVLKDDMLKTLEISLASNGNWNSTSHSNFKKLPMWGESSQHVISSTTTALSSPVTMIRMVAKINVQLDNVTSNANLFNEFKLTGVHVYNTSLKGRIVPSTIDADWNSATLTAKRPTMPQSWLIANRQEGPLFYNDFTSPGIQDQKMTNAIYTFEMPTHGDSDKRPCLVIQGRYKTDAADSYYRVEYILKSDNSYIPILRNHQYIVNIVNVKGSGYGTADQAYRAKPVNMEVEILDWNTPGMKHVVDDGQYFLSVSQDDFSFYRDEKSGDDGDNALYVLTDYSTTSVGAKSGWYVEKIVNAADGSTPITWLTVRNTANLGQHPAEGVANSKAKLLLTFGENTTSANRRAIVWIAAGRMRYPVSVTQSTTANIMVRVDDVTNAVAPKKDIAELVFPSGIWTSDPITAKSITINWAPFAHNNPCRSIATTIGTSFNFGTGTVMPAGNQALTALAGKITYNNIIPKKFTASEVASPNQFLEKTTLYTYTTSNGEKNLTKTLMLRQVHYNAVAVTTGSYILNGTPAEFYIKSNSSWQLELLDGKKVIDPATYSIQYGGYDTRNGQKVAVQLHNEIGSPHSPAIVIANPVFKIVCTDPERHFDPVEFSICCAALTPPTGTYEAPPGVIGIGAQTGRLTLDGSQGYEGGTAGEKVWIVYFKWGSLIALKSNSKNDAWVNGVSNIGWAVPEFIANGGLSTISDYASVPHYAPVDAKTLHDLHTSKATLAKLGFGDPCRYAYKNGVVGGYKTPLKEYWPSEWNGTPSLFPWMGSGCRNDGYGGFYPAAGDRYHAGILSGGIIGYYWSASPAISTSAYSLSFAELVVNTTYSQLRSNSFTMRCIPE